MYPRPPTWSSPSGQGSQVEKLGVLQVCRTSFECTMRLPVNPFFSLLVPIRDRNRSELFRVSLMRPVFLITRPPPLARIWPWPLSDPGRSEERPAPSPHFTNLLNPHPACPDSRSNDQQPDQPIPL